ncbi:hypothetical protein HCH15_08500 [Corynebacterium testudinoris]|uniref:Putative DUF2910 family protein n=1 Tax=Corynebacterium testudinoris TaxID=136857 RepID=A0A0G3H806_9CORY|nr:membrane protein [Corynebacterium testudinoris]AKK09536.1 putative DUF2910 family protein [Corynebacterium testudinoris]MBX8996219.1 hypothetical protein [Corynebacterium testudinoris]
MFQAVMFALMDSLNALLIGIIVALGVMLPRGARYRQIVTRLVFGDWLGVLLLALITLLIFDGLGDVVRRALESPIFGWVLIVVGVVTFLLTVRGSGSVDTKVMNRFLEPLQNPSLKTVGAGFVLGVVQSATSAPFFLGLGHLSAGDFSVTTRYIGLLFYASLALSLPAISAVFIGLVRAYPYSPFGRAFEYLRQHKELTVKASGYIVAAALTIYGIVLLV